MNTSSAGARRAAVDEPGRPPHHLTRDKESQRLDLLLGAGPAPVTIQDDVRPIRAVEVVNRHESVSLSSDSTHMCRRKFRLSRQSCMS